MKLRYDFMRCDKEQKVYTERSGGGAVQRMDDAALTLIDIAALICSIDSWLTSNSTLL